MLVARIIKIIIKEKKIPKEEREKREKRGRDYHS